MTQSPTAMSASPLDRRIRHEVERSLPVTTAAVGGLLFLPLVLGLGSSSYLGVAALAWLAAAGLALGEPASDRRFFVALFGLSFAVRLLAHIVLFAVGAGAGGPFLGPDSALYHAVSLDLAVAEFEIPLHPALHFGSYDSAHYYVFAGAIRFLGADLFALQLLNCAFTALVGPLMFGVARASAVPFRAGIAVATVLFPSLIVLSAVDLLKDSSVLFALALTLWGLSHLAEARRWRPLVLHGLFVAAGLAYLRMDRFYFVLFLELALGFSLVVTLIRGRGAMRAVPATVVGLSAVLVAELGPARLGWPPTPLLARSQLPQLSQLIGYAPGFFDRPEASPPAPVDERGATKEDPASPAARARAARASGSDGFPPAAAATRRATRAVDWTVRGGVRPILAGIVPGVHAASPQAATETDARRSTVTARAIPLAANLVRKLYGPFVWIWPERWAVRDLLVNDYLLYPGMLIWYGVLPFAAGGIVMAGWRLLRGPGPPFVLVAVWAFVVMDLAYYLVFNVSYRQRDALFPLALLFAACAASAWHGRLARRAYFAYWVALGGLALGHLVARSMMGPNV